MNQIIIAENGDFKIIRAVINSKRKISCVRRFSREGCRMWRKRRRLGDLRLNTWPVNNAPKPAAVA